MADALCGRTRLRSSRRRSRREDTAIWVSTMFGGNARKQAWVLWLTDDTIWQVSSAVTTSVPLHSWRRVQHPKQGHAMARMFAEPQRLGKRVLGSATFSFLVLPGQGQSRCATVSLSRVCDMQPWPGRPQSTSAPKGRLLRALGCSG